MKLKKILLEILLKEVSIDQLKQQFVDTGKIEDSVFNDIVKASNNKSAYATWLINKVNDKLIKTEDIYKWKEYLSIFDRRKNNYSTYKDIFKVKTKNDIKNFLDITLNIKNSEDKDPSKIKGISKTDKYEKFKIGEVNGFIIYEIPKGSTDLHGVSCELGSGTEWCTAHSGASDSFKHYINEGPLFIIINKSNPDEKYQFSYEANQFMDKNDNNIFEI